jgi:23S rRNA pseudouridine955/2504/2580 synthase
MNTLSLNPGVKTIKVTEERDGQRLDNFLLGLLKGAPRSLIYKIIRDGQVRVNGKREKPEYRLEEDDLVRVPPVKIEVADPNRVPPKAMLERLEASIVFEDKALLVLNKPSGIATHGGSGISFGVIEALRALRPNEPLELVHRLDRDTSGVLVCNCRL